MHSSVFPSLIILSYIFSCSEPCILSTVASLVNMANIPAFVALNLIPAILFTPQYRPDGYVFRMMPEPESGINVTRTDWTAECREPSFIFGTKFRFLGCLFYQNVTKRLTTGDNDEFGGVAYTSDDKAQLGAFGYESMSDTTNETVTRHREIVTACMQYHCSRSPYCLASASCDTNKLHINAKLPGQTVLSGNQVAKCWLHVCGGEDRSPNPDIAGIGVRSSSPSRANYGTYLTRSRY